MLSRNQVKLVLGLVPGMGIHTASSLLIRDALAPCNSQNEAAFNLLKMTLMSTRVTGWRVRIGHCPALYNGNELEPQADVRLVQGIGFVVAGRENGAILYVAPTLSRP
jgi:hypothetical protein